MALGVRTVVHQNLRHIPVTGVHLPGEKHQIGEVRIEDAGLHHDTARVLAISRIVSRKCPMPHASQCRDTQSRQQHADHTEQERRGKHLIDVDAPRTQATSSRSVLMRRKVRKTLSIQAMGITSMRNSGVI